MGLTSLYIPAWLAALSHHISRYLIGGLIFTHEILSHIHSFVAIFDSLSKDICDLQNHPRFSLGWRMYSVVGLVSLINLFIFLTHCTGWSEIQVAHSLCCLHAKKKLHIYPEPNSLSKDACDLQTHPQASHGGRSYSVVPTLSCSA